MKKVGFIGLGIMGKPMARNLLKAGYELVVCDSHQSNIDAVCEGGPAHSAPNGAAVAREAEVIVTMLPNSPNVRAVVCGPGGILETARPGTIVVFDQVYEMLLAMGSSAVHCGAIGAGNTTKLANQIIVAANIAAVSEAFMLAVRAGVDPHLVFDAIKGGLAGSAVLNAKAPMMMDRNFAPGFRVDLHIKDLNNALDTGHGVGSPLPLTATVMEMLQTLHADGYGREDHSALARYYEKLTGTLIQ